MNRIITTLTLFLFISVLVAQPTFTESAISTSADGAWSVHAVDLDGDGDMDVLSASGFDDKIAWYENDGSQSFTEHVISTSVYFTLSVYAADVDGDGDMDVLSASYDDYKIAWYENNGSESFTEHTISTSAYEAWSVHAADVDGDGDMDVLSASFMYDKIAWYENDGSEGFTQHVISTSADGAISVHAADMDGDGDMDVFSASGNDDKIAWYENDGSEIFTEHTISTSANGAYSVYAADVDGDGDLDVLSASYSDDKIAWYENDGSEGFTEHAISTSANGAYSVYAADVDGDGDMDVLSASGFDDKIAWYKNNGSQSFTEHAISTSADGAKDVYAADVDGDGDMDVLSASSFDDKIAWYENDGSPVQTTYVPDDNFEQALIDLGYDDAMDDYVLTANISGVTSLDVGEKEISDLTGIAGFTALTSLSCDNNSLTALDMSSNTALTYLQCGDNQLTELDVSANTVLTNLYCGENQLTSLDVTANTALTILYCDNNQLTALDVSANTALTTLDFEHNELTSLDVSANTALYALSCNYNELTSLDVSSNTALIYLYCYYNQLTSLDVSANTALTSLKCDNNQLTSLNMKNGVTDGLTTFDATDNSLDCIEVNEEDVDYATTNWTYANGNIDDGVTFSNICSSYYTYVPDDNFEQALIDLGYDDAMDDYVLTANISGVTSLYVIEKEISDLTGIEDFTGLTELKCQENNLSALDVSQNTGLTLLNCGGNNLTAIDVSANTALIQLNTYDNQLTALDVSNNTAITTMWCYNNQFTALDLSANTALTKLYVNDNALATLDLSANTALTILQCGGNELTALDVSTNTVLTTLRVPNNQLTALDVSANTALTTLYCQSNPELFCIQVADVDQAEQDWGGGISSWMGFSTDCESYVLPIYVPDDNFEQALIDLGYDSALDNYVAAGNISGVTSLDVREKEISDLTGIEGFTALTVLICKENNLSALDVSALTALTELKCQENNLSALDVSALTALTYLNCGGNNLEALDVSVNTALITLNTYDNNLTSLDVSNNTAITTMWCYDNQFTALDVSALTALDFLNCHANQLTALDLGNNTLLDDLSVGGNQLTELNLSANAVLTELKCGNNQLTSLDISANTALTELKCANNQLTALDISANTALTTLMCHSNPELYCIQVADVDQAEQDWGDDLSSWMVFNTDCESYVPAMHVPDDNFEQALIDLGYDDVLDDYVLIENISSVTSLDVGEKEISDLTGIEAFIALTVLDCDQNQIPTLDVSNNTALTYLNCSVNPITSLDVSNNTALTSLSCYYNQLTSLDVSNNTALTYLSCSGSSSTSSYGVTNQITELDVSNNTALTYLACSQNQLTTLDVSNNTALTYLSCSSNQLTSLDVSNNTALASLQPSYNAITSLDVSNNTALTSLGCYYMELTSLDVSNNTALMSLYCSQNQLTTLDVSNNTALTSLYCSGNQLTTLDVSNNTALTRLYCHYNEITTLDVSANTALTWLYCYGNQLTALDVSANTALTRLYCQYNQLTYLNMRNGVTDELEYFNATNNPDLSCIETLDLDYATTNWTNDSGNIDEGVTFSVICGSGEQDVWHVSTNGSDGSGNGTQESPFATIQMGINVAGDGNTVQVAAGTYLENISYSGKSISVLGEDRETTIVDGDSSGAVLLFDGDDSYTIHLSGFTITNGSNSNNGGGIGIEDGMDIDISDLIITGNIASSGGGVLIGSSTGALSDLIISDNEANSGGGLSCYESELTLHDLYIHDNNGLNNTGGASFGSSTIDLYSSVFTGNHAYFNGGALRVNSEGEYNFTNLTIIGNSTGYSGCSPCHASRGSALDIGTDADVNISNSIIWDNTGAVAEIVFGINQTSGTLNMSYTDLHGGQDEILEWNGEWVNVEENIVNWGEGNIDADPLFCEADSGNYHIAGNSPCAGTGLDGADMGALGVGCDDIWFPPTIAAIQDTSIDEDGELSIQLSAESSQGYNIEFQAQSDTSSVYAYVDGDMLNIDLMTDWNGTAGITVVAYCEFNDEINDTASFTLTVNPVDDLPYVDGHIYPRDYPEDFGSDTVAYLPDVFVDIDGDLTFSYSFTVDGVVAADVSSDHLVLSSMDNANGTTQLLLTASNPMRASVTDTVDIEVWPINDLPVVDIPNALLSEDSELYWDISEYMSDVESEELWVDVGYVSEPMSDYVDAHMHGSDTLHLIAHDNWHGEGEIEINVSDGESDVSDVFALTVRSINDEPVFENHHALVGVGMEFHVPIHVYDVDMDSLVVSFDGSWDYPEWLSLDDGPYALTGTAPEPVSIHFPLQVTDAEVTVTDTFHLSAQFFNPRITSITDIPDDQGGRVYLSFLKSFFDEPDETNQMYTIYRHDMVDNNPEWVVVGSGAAIGDESYTYEVSTLADSTFESDGMTEFKVVASMDEGHFHSAPESGYSLDNIAPGAPEGLMAVVVDEGIQLSWDMNDEDDFQYFVLEKSYDEAFTEAEVFEMIDTTYFDPDYILNESNYYRLAAVDHAGNMSEYSSVVDIAVLSIDLDLIPDVYALHQNYPNPFNPVTTLRYDLPEDAMVSITIYDVMGRRVKSLVNTTQVAGYRSVRWDATNSFGEPVSAGMYIYMIQAGQFTKTKKMVLLK